MLLYGKPCAEFLSNHFASNCKDITLCCIGFQDQEWQQYTSSLKRNCDKYNFGFCEIVAPSGCSVEDFCHLVKSNCQRDDVDGVIVQQPLPKGYSVALESLCCEKDVDCLNPLTISKLYLGNAGLRPATPTAVLHVLDYYNIDLQGKNVVIVGRGNAVGKPLALMMLQRNATVTICHSKTQNLPQACRQADVLVSACGVPGLITTEHVNPNAIVIDVGLSFVNGKSCGDVSTDVYDRCQAVTPVPGGVGPVTCVSLLHNLFLAHNSNK